MRDVQAEMRKIRNCYYSAKSKRNEKHPKKIIDNYLFAISMFFLEAYFSDS